MKRRIDNLKEYPKKTLEVRDSRKRNWTNENKCIDPKQSAKEKLRNRIYGTRLITEAICIKTSRGSMIEKRKRKIIKPEMAKKEIRGQDNKSLELSGFRLLGSSRQGSKK